MPSAEATPSNMATPDAEALPQDPTRFRIHDGHMRSSTRDNWTIFWLVVLAIFIPPLAVLCVTSCDVQFALKLLFEFLTFGSGSFIHAIWVVFYYGKGGRLSWGQRKKIERQRVAEALELPAVPANTRPPLARNEADADAAAYGAPGGRYDNGDSKYL